MEIMIEGKPAEDLKLPISSLGIPGRQEHLLHSVDFSSNGFAERASDEHANSAIKEGANGVSKELLASRVGFMNGLASDKSPPGVLNIEMNSTPSPQSDKCAHEHQMDAFKQEETPQSDEKETAHHRQGNWVYAEILILLEAKAKEYGFPCGESKRSRLSADDKWKQVAEYCKSKGVQRTKEQCRVKWDNMMPDYRKVRDYDEQKEASAPSYFQMDVWERRMKLLPSNMDAEIYHRIASIQSNKPTKGGLKREAREKRPLDLSNLLTPSQPTKRLSNGLEGVDFEGERPRLADLVGKHIASSAPRKRRRRRAPEMVFSLEKRVEPMPKIDLRMEPVVRTDLQMQNDSSTEDDAAVVSSRSQQGTPAAACMYAERSSFLPAHQTPINESRDVLPVPYRSQNPLQQAASVIVERGNSSSVLEGPPVKGSWLQETKDITQKHEAANQVEDRKDARHRELMALEREKLAVFREATFAIANAMTNAMAVFSKVAEELLLRRG
ncbi:hypothetical protein GOP47_0016033 [Adiantum capillus-veneris]|uniref:Myb-like domain-containing protein n=1 Tax=Adiantum capillus-veneris TaxID=13818 RepID=A0A9D4ULK6_ADICA|nr:hypothetical protein GOP47_0016033 [Adiantum capillus-veneris]